jgi:hypothetical protein
MRCLDTKEVIVMCYVYLQRMKKCSKYRRTFLWIVLYE